jgi:hypothetical protein
MEGKLMLIQGKDWQWYGLPGHFIGSQDCRFHLNTKIGNVIISTVGEYHPHNSNKPQEIGCDRFYETMVFPAEKEQCNCGCGMYRVNVNRGELDFKAYDNADSANKGHIKMCIKWAKMEGNNYE